jgi:hypothetical protein
MKQAAHVLLEAFPVQSAEAPRAEAEAALSAQFDCMQALLDDPEVRVRALAAEGVCRVLAQFWELLPTAVAKALLQVCESCFPVQSQAFSCLMTVRWHELC